MNGPYTFGADPEMFLKDGDGKFISAWKHVPGTKKRPHAVANGAVQLDGMAAEFNIAPASSEREFVHNINTVLAQLASMIPAEYKLTAASVAHFEPTHLATMPVEVLELGCDPDYNAYTRTRNPRPDQHPTMRTASGHVHIGFTSEYDVHDFSYFMECCDLTRQLDYFLGIPSILLDENGAERRKMYGQPGCFRPKPYGVEYRVLSNFWLTSEELMIYVFRQAERAIQDMDYLFVPGEFGDAARDVIMNNDKKRAEEILKAMGVWDEILQVL